MIEAGQKAPFFKGLNENGEEITLDDYKGHKLILFFYPKDNTPGCTAEACSLRDNYEALTDAGFKMLGVSPDDTKKHKKFQDKFDFPFSLLADTEKEALQAYGAWGRKKFMGKEYDGVLRTTFIINEEGVVEHVIKKVKTKAHAQQILDLVNEE